MKLLVLDVGTSGVRAAVVTPEDGVVHSHHQEVLPSSPAPGLVEFDASVMAEAVLAVASQAASEAGTVDAVGIANQRASTVVWDRATGQPVGPGLGWQDLRTVVDCLILAGEGLRLAPNLVATKAAHLVKEADPDGVRDLCVGTVDSWVAWTLTQGAVHVTDRSNAALYGMLTADQDAWDEHTLDLLKVPLAAMPTVVDSIGVIGAASALPGAPPLTGILGDQQASLLGQGCVRPGQAKITFGTGGMLDLCLDGRPRFETQGTGGTFPIVTRSIDGNRRWGLEAVMLAAGTNVEWLRDDLQIIADAADSHTVASQCETSDGVAYVPALLGLGAPTWDYGARGALLGLTRGSGRPQIVRAVLEGVAQRAADLVDAAETDSGLAIPTLRVDGGMSANPTFLQALADATQRRIEVSPEREATTLGAAYAAGLAIGAWPDDDAIAASWDPAEVVEPVGSFDRERWADTLRRAEKWFPDLSAISF
ncbi:FGGY family carbohydrate kinase [Aquihabitans daechungensis]|uniref:FGGY family carbohydrate kinase n=1 Tax=Aquihabitans daechungensis TaxID=1052257 RepID=UPI003BA10C96